jgi:hypothetical protein
VALLAAHVAAGQAGAQDGGRFGQKFQPRLVSTRTPFASMAELVQAVSEQDVDKVKVRRPLEAVSSSECGPSRAARLGLGQWTLEAFRRTPDSALLCRISPPYVTPQSNFIMNAGAPPCRSERHVP